MCSAKVLITRFLNIHNIFHFLKNCYKSLVQNHELHKFQLSLIFQSSLLSIVWVSCNQIRFYYQIIKWICLISVITKGLWYSQTGINQCFIWNQGIVINTLLFFLDRNMKYLIQRKMTLIFYQVSLLLLKPFNYTIL